MVISNVLKCVPSCSINLNLDCDLRIPKHLKPIVHNFETMTIPTLPWKSLLQEQQSSSRPGPAAPQNCLPGKTLHRTASAGWTFAVPRGGADSWKWKKGMWLAIVIFFACNHHQGGDSFGFRVFHQRIDGKQKRNMQFHPQNEQIQNQYCCAA